MPLTDDVCDQAIKYDQVTGANFFAITNGEETLWYQPSGEGYVQLSRPPNKREIYKKIKVPPAEESPLPARPAFGDLSELAKKSLEDSFAIGAGSPISNHRYLFNLAGLFHLEPMPSQYLKSWGRYRLLEWGTRFATFGNSVGGAWPGKYQYFVLEDPNGESQIVSLSVLAKMMTRNDPVFGNTNGHTMLLLAVDDFENRHASLELDLDKFVRAEGSQMVVWHDGTLTKGKRGAAKREEVVAFVGQSAPDLVRNNRIHLGSFPGDRLATWADVEDLLRRCALYALARDDFRRDVR